MVMPMARPWATFFSTNGGERRPEVAETVQRPVRVGAEKIGASPGAANTEPAQEGNVHPVA
jgi:hypothetical protein